MNRPFGPSRPRNGPGSVTWPWADGDVACVGMVQRSKKRSISSVVKVKDEDCGVSDTESATSEGEQQGWEMVAAYALLGEAPKEGEEYNPIIRLAVTRVPAPPPRSSAAAQQKKKQRQRRRREMREMDEDDDDMMFEDGGGEEEDAGGSASNVAADVDMKMPAMRAGGGQWAYEEVMALAMPTRPVRVFLDHDWPRAFLPLRGSGLADFDLDGELKGQYCY